MKATNLELSGLVLLEPEVHADARGVFFESFNERDFREATGFDVRFVQDNHSISAKGVVRGLHYQLPPNAQGKLVRVVAGRAFDVAVDVRRTSETFGKWLSVELSGENRRQLWIPPGFAHGFLALDDHTQLLYKTTTFWDASSEYAIRWDDPDVGIQWPTEALPLVSTKDSQSPFLRSVDVFA